MSEWDRLLDDVAIGQAVQALPMDRQRLVARVLGPTMPALAKALPVPWPDRPRADPPRPVLPLRRAEAALVREAPQTRKAPPRVKPEPDAAEAAWREADAILSRIPDPPARRRRPVTEPAEVMRALDALADRIPRAPRPGDRGDGDKQRRLDAALQGVLDRALAALRAGDFTADQVAAVEVRVNMLRRRAGLLPNAGDRTR